MNKEKRKFKKIIKTRKKRAGKMKSLAQERLSRRISLGDIKRIIVAENKKRSIKVTEARHERFEHLRKVLNMPETETMTLDALEEAYLIVSKAVKEEAKENENITHKS